MFLNSNMKQLLTGWIILIIVLIACNSCGTHNSKDMKADARYEIKVGLEDLYTQYQHTFNAFIEKNNTDSALVYLGRMASLRDARAVAVKALE